MTPSRPIRILLPVLVAVVLGACSDDGGATGSTPPAATVDGTEIPAEVLVDEVEAIAGNAAYVEAFEAAAASRAHADLRRRGRRRRVRHAFVTDTLGVRIQYEIVGDEVERRGLEVTEACTDVARDALVARFTSPDAGSTARSSSPASARTTATTSSSAHAEFFALRADLAGNPCGEETSDEAVQAYFEANEAELSAETACASHILVATRRRPTRSVALLAARRRLRHPRRRALPGHRSGAAGGELGCAPPGQYVEPFDEAVFSQPVGEVGEPVADRVRLPRHPRHRAGRPDRRGGPGRGRGRAQPRRSRRPSAPGSPRRSDRPR